MMQQMYELAVRLSLQTPGFATGVSGVVSAFQLIQRHAGLTGGSLDKLGRAFRVFAAGAALTGFGAGMLSFLDSAVKRAMDLQTVLLGVQTATQATPQQMAKLSDVALQIGLRNQMSQTDVARVMNAATQAGISDPRQLQQMIGPLANFGEILKMRRGMDPAQAASIAAQYAHIFGAYEPKMMGPMVNLLGRAMFISPTSPERFMALSSQFAGPLRTLYGTSQRGRTRAIEDTITATALLSQMGQETRGGTQLVRIITQTLGAGTAARSGLQIRALRRIEQISHTHFFDARTGTFTGMSNLIMALERTAAAPGATPRTVGALFQRAFGQVGTRMAGLLSDPVSFERFRGLGRSLGPGGLPKLEDIQRWFNQTPQGQLNQARKNWETLSTLIGTQLLPTVTPLVKALAQMTRTVVLFARAHPAIVRFIAVFAAVAAAVALVVGPILMLAGGVMAFMALGGFAALAVALAPVLIGLAIFIGVITAVTLVITHWKEITHAVGVAFSYLGTKLHDLFKWLGLIPAARHAAAGGGRSGFGGGTGPAVHITNHFHGMDHQSAQHLAKTAADHIARQVHHATQYHATAPHDLAQGLHGI